MQMEKPNPADILAAWSNDFDQWHFVDADKTEEPCDADILLELIHRFDPRRDKLSKHDLCNAHLMFELVPKSAAKAVGVYLLDMIEITSSRYTPDSFDELVIFLNSRGAFKLIDCLTATQKQLVASSLQFAWSRLSIKESSEMQSYVESAIGRLRGLSR